MDKDRFQEIVQPGLGLHGHDEQVNHVRGLRSQDVGPEDSFGAFFDQEFGEPVVIAAGQTGVAAADSRE